ncbi:MAG: diguanylate cyclase [Verrucomicrobia bacterium]|nr:diguanylate cyclase [Verrucomicrobiota bacterium]
MFHEKRILLIDDDPAIARLIGALVAGFRRGPFALDHAADFVSGLAQLEGGRHQLCLLDYHLGDRDGLELLREARVRHCQTPVIFLTGEALDETDFAAMDHGAVDFMTKAEITPRGLERAVCFALKLGETIGQLQQLATHDELTGALNRREFTNRLEEEVLRTNRFQRPFALVLLDLDHFKEINDAHGHPAGDKVLRHVVRVISNCLRPTDAVGRFGGDEFGVLLIESTRADGRAAAGRLQAAVAESPCRIVERVLTIETRISAGVAACREDADTVEELVDAADRALYFAKRLGRNQVCAAGTLDPNPLKSTTIPV